MLLSTIILQLQRELPKSTNLFTDQLAISSLTFSGGTVTATTVSFHGLSTDNIVNITGAKNPAPISSLTFADGIATAETTVDHDLTLHPDEFAAGFRPQIEIVGADDALYNGFHDLVPEPETRFKFQFKVSGSPNTPDTGSPILLVPSVLGYNGLHQITVTGNTTFTYPSPITLESPAQGTIVMHKNIRVSGAATIERALEGYTKQIQNEFWAFVVKDQGLYSKDREIRNDATLTQTAGDAFRARKIRQFSIYVVAPATQSISGLREADAMDEVEVAFGKSLFGFKLPNLFSENSFARVTPVNESHFAYNNAQYIHKFDYETVVDVTSCDTVAVEAFTRSFRDFCVHFKRADDETFMLWNFPLDE